jgi:hypothetical protein
VAAHGSSNALPREQTMARAAGLVTPAQHLSVAPHAASRGSAFEPHRRPGAGVGSTEASVHAARLASEGMGSPVATLAEVAYTTTAADSEGAAALLMLSSRPSHAPPPATYCDPSSGQTPANSCPQFCSPAPLKATAAASLPQANSTHAIAPPSRAPLLPPRPVMPPPMQLELKQLQAMDKLGLQTFSQLRSVLIAQQQEYRCQVHILQWLLLQRSVLESHVSSAGVDPHTLAGQVYFHVRVLNA